MYEDSIREEFTHQSKSFGTSAAMTSAQTLGALIELVPEDPRRAGSTSPAARA